MSDQKQPHAPHSTSIALVLTRRGEVVSADCNGEKLLQVLETEGERADKGQGQGDEGRDRWEMTFTLGEAGDDCRVSWSSTSARSVNFTIQRLAREEAERAKDTDRDRWELTVDVGPGQGGEGRHQLEQSSYPAGSGNGSGRVGLDEASGPSAH